VIASLINPTAFPETAQPSSGNSTILDQADGVEIPARAAVGGLAGNAEGR
jgi:hypothetical protein